MTRSLRIAGLLLLVVLLPRCSDGQREPATSRPKPRPVPAKPLDTKGPPAVVLLQPHADLFWKAFVGFMQAATDDLGMRLIVIDAGDSRQKMLEQARLAVASRPRPAALVFQNFKQIGTELLQVAERAGVPAFVVNAAVPGDAGAPRQRFKHWIGEMLPDDELAGAEQARVLIDTARRRGLVDERGKVQLLAIGGGVKSVASIERLRGLRKTVAARKQDVNLAQVVYGNWDRARARRQVALLRKRYPEVTAVWVANDNMALGVVEALGPAAGKRVLVGGVDWSPEALPAIRRGQLTVSMGGHFVEGAWAVVLLHDYRAGKDFAQLGTRFRSTMGRITAENLTAYQALLQQERWGRIDFRKFSRAANPRWSGYDFSWPAIRRAADE